MRVLIGNEYKELDKKDQIRVRIAEVEGWYCHYCKQPLHNLLELMELAASPDSCVRIDSYRHGFPKKCPRPDCPCDKKYQEYNKHNQHKLYPTLDHKLPKSHGGARVFSNMVLCCDNCNQSKADKTYEEFLGA